MRDIGHEETEKVLLGIEKRITAEYSRAEKEIQKKLDTYMKLFAVKDRLKLMAVDKGLISEGEYKQWRLGQVMVGKRWEEMRNTIAQDLSAASQIARSIAFDHIPDVYAINHDYGTFLVEKGALVDTSYTLYDRNAMEQLYKNEDTFIPAAGRKISRAINEGRQVAWDKKQVQSVMMQGLLQGEPISGIATRLSKTVGESDRKAAIRNARTLTTGVENAGRTASYDRANALGIKTKKQWLAALDMRTRHWHAELDGVSVDNDKPFHNEYGDIMYPGDPTADPANIFNCRCTLIAAIEGFENDLSDMSLRRDEKLGDMSYDEWKAGHYDIESDRITKQDEIAETMKRVYGAEYAKYSKNVDNNIVKGYYRNKDKFVINSEYKEKASMKNVKYTMREMGIDYGHSRIVIDRTPGYVGTEYYAHTADDGSVVTFYPDAFIDKETLVKTIGHEKIHLNQVKHYGIATDSEELHRREKEAAESEMGWWKAYNEKRKN